MKPLKIFIPIVVASALLSQQQPAPPPPVNVTSVPLTEPQSLAQRNYVLEVQLRRLRIHLLQKEIAELNKEQMERVAQWCAAAGGKGCAIDIERGTLTWPESSEPSK